MASPSQPPDQPITGTWATPNHFAEGIEHERSYVRRLYARLNELREEKKRQLAAVRRAAQGGTPQARSERDAFATHYEDRLTQLEAVEDNLVFGRLDLDDEQVHYIGRIGLTDEELNQLLVDWRAPEAAAFYQATPIERMGVRRRRHLVLRGRAVLAIDDDILDSALLTSGADIRGEAALLAAVSSKRTGRMGDIVATIQAEQDRIVRAPMAGALVVQGGPGTGKTAVALHRAAYLLYSNRERLATARVLVVGPSLSFLTYIERVLPSLGETGVVMASLGELWPAQVATAVEAPAVARLKGRPVMAEAIAQAVENRQRVPASPRTLHVGTYRLTLSPANVVRARTKARETGRPHNEARHTFVQLLLDELTDQLVSVLHERSPHSEAAQQYAASDVRSARDVRVALNLAWMPMTPQRLLSDLFSKPELLAEVAPQLSEFERQLLYRSAEAPWTVADIPLLDEADELLGPIEAPHTARQSADHRNNMHNATRALENVHASLVDAGVDGVVSAEQLVAHQKAEERVHLNPQGVLSDREWTFGHIVVDEAQELSPMQWRLLTRRCPLKSFTIVGDIAQASAASDTSSWQQVMEPHFGQRWRQQELTVNYRTPEQIATAATRMARAAGRSVPQTRSVRPGRWPVLIDRVEDPLVLLPEVLSQEHAAVDWGLVAVVAARARLPEIFAQLQRSHGDRVSLGLEARASPLIVVDPQEAKGLEFDSVIIVEPAELVDTHSGPLGVADLYVAMTRPTQRLRLLVSGPVPAGIEAPASLGEEAALGRMR